MQSNRKLHSSMVWLKIQRMQVKRGARKIFLVSFCDQDFCQTFGFVAGLCKSEKL